MGCGDAVKGRHFGYNFVHAIFSRLDPQGIVPIVVEIAKLRGHLSLSLGGVNMLGPSHDLEEWESSPEMIDSTVLHSPGGILLDSALDVIFRLTLGRFGQIGIARATSQVEQG